MTTFQTPRAVAFTPTGELVILDVGAKQVVEFDRAAQTRRVLASDLPVGNLPDAPSGGIAVGRGASAVSVASAVGSGARPRGRPGAANSAEGSAVGAGCGG